MTARQEGTEPPARERRPPADSQAPRTAGSRGSRKLPAKWWPWFGLLLVLNFVVVSYLFLGPEVPVEVSYTFFRDQVEAGNVQQISTRGDAVEGTFEKPVTYPPGGGDNSRTTTRFTTAIPSFANTRLEQMLIDKGVQIKSEPLEQPRSLWESLLFSFGPALLLIGLFVWLSRRAAAQGGLGGALSDLGAGPQKRSSTASEPPKPRTTSSRRRT